MIILLDGSKGAGKTTTGEILPTRIDNCVYLSLDNERRALGSNEASITERNREAFEHLLKKIEQSLNKNLNIIVDCGLIEDRVSRISELGKKNNVPVHKFLLKAHYETQLNRVRLRDKSKGRQADEQRFAEVHAIVHAKDFNDFIIIETDTVTPEEVVNIILQTIQQS